MSPSSRPLCKQQHLGVGPVQCLVTVQHSCTLPYMQVIGKTILHVAFQDLGLVQQE